MYSAQCCVTKDYLVNIAISDIRRQLLGYLLAPLSGWHWQKQFALKRESEGRGEDCNETARFEPKSRSGSGWRRREVPFHRSGMSNLIPTQRGGGGNPERQHLSVHCVLLVLKKVSLTFSFSIDKFLIALNCMCKNEAYSLRCYGQNECSDQSSMHLFEPETRAREGNFPVTVCITSRIIQTHFSKQPNTCCLCLLPDKKLGLS